MLAIEPMALHEAMESFNLLNTLDSLLLNIRKNFYFYFKLVCLILPPWGERYLLLASGGLLIK